MDDIPIRQRLFPDWRLWALLATIMAVDALWLIVTPLRLDMSGLLLPALVSVLLAALLLSGGRGRSPLRDFTMGLGFLTLAWTALRVLNHLLMSLPFPYADDVLASWDAMLGLDWTAYAHWVAERPFVNRVFDLAYGSLTPLTLLAYLGLFALGRRDRAHEFVTLFMILAPITMVIAAAFPAQAAMVHHAPSAALRAAFSETAGVYHLDHLRALRHVPDHVLDMTALPGLATFPSFHTIAGLLLAYCCRDIRVIFPATALYATVMIASTPIYGGHYFIDLLAGGLLFAAVMIAYRARHATTWRTASISATTATN